MEPVVKPRRYRPTAAEIRKKHRNRVAGAVLFGIGLTVIAGAVGVGVYRYKPTIVLETQSRTVPLPNPAQVGAGVQKRAIIEHQQ